MGARDAVLWSDESAMTRLADTFDLLITTVPKAYPIQPFVNVRIASCPSGWCGPRIRGMQIAAVTTIYARSR